MIETISAISGLQEQVREVICKWASDSARREVFVEDILADSAGSNLLAGDERPVMTKDPIAKIKALLGRAEDIMVEEIDMIIRNIKKHLIEEPHASAAGHSMRISAESFEFYDCPSDYWRDHDSYYGVAFYHDFDDTDTLAWVHDLFVRFRGEIGQMLLLCAINPGGQSLSLRDSRLGRLLDNPPVRIRLPDQAFRACDSLYQRGLRRRRHVIRRQFAGLIEKFSAFPEFFIGKRYLHVGWSGITFSDEEVPEFSGISILLPYHLRCGAFVNAVLDEAPASFEVLIDWACMTDPGKVPQVAAYDLSRAFEYPRSRRHLGAFADLVDLVIDV
ncbi:hypothetical protein JJB09_25565 [Rhizobium sp. KVB221]|uniref:Uncharacterized protein n=1 Tax=Rhizobium setariae TaxID=2801340 RepID=A0A937CR49_9HYPH|nr:hypothetical protein [Rhizobium setariae]MBL0375384.1 hypothetical protein [Rhizobium setariae]